MVLENAVHAVLVADWAFARYSPEDFAADWLRPLTEHPAIRGVTVIGDVGRFAAAGTPPRVAWVEGDLDEIKHLADAAAAPGVRAVLRLRHTQGLRFPLSRGILDAALDGYAATCAGGYFQLDLYDVPYDGLVAEVFGPKAAAALRTRTLPLDWVAVRVGARRGFPVERGILPLPARVALLQDPRVEYYRFPKFIALEASRLCNLRCTMCALHSDFIDHSHTDHHPKHFDLGRYRAILDQLEPYKGHCLIAPQFWGEPFMSPYLKDMIREGRARGFTLTFTTNGTLWDEEMIDFMIDQQVFALCVSMDGATKATYEQVRIGANFDTVVANLNRLVERKREKGVTLPILQVNMALFPENRHEQQQLIDDWLGKADFVSISNHCVNNVVPELHFRPERIPCPTLWSGMHINTNGDVIACCRDSSYEEVMGNVFTAPVLDVWNNAKYAHFRKKHLLREWEDIPMCVRCDSWACRSRRVERRGELVVNQYPFYQHFMPAPAGRSAATIAMKGHLTHLVDRVKDTGRGVRQTLVGLGSRLRKAS